jgi:rare lipoprotein A (peptidoglycan hydrolase)
MKRFGAVFMFGLVSVYCFAQSQTGNASYNASKSGFTISHSSMSFGTAVRITNLGNNSQVIATVDGRIPAGDPRVADISREAGDAVGMARSGYTVVRIEQLHEPQAAVPAPPAVAPPPEEPPRQPPPPPPAPPPENREEIIQVITPSQVQYIPAPVVEQAQNCPLSPAVVVLLAIVAALLTAILVLLIQARRSVWWPGYPWWFGRYPLWAQRRVRYAKERRRKQS